MDVLGYRFFSSCVNSWKIFCSWSDFDCRRFFTFYEFTQGKRIIFTNPQWADIIRTLHGARMTHPDLKRINNKLDIIWTICGPIPTIRKSKIKTDQRRRLKNIKIKFGHQSGTYIGLIFVCGQSSTEWINLRTLLTSFGLHLDWIRSCKLIRTSVRPTRGNYMLRDLYNIKQYSTCKFLIKKITGCAIILWKKLDIRFSKKIKLRKFFWYILSILHHLI